MKPFQWDKTWYVQMALPIRLLTAEHRSIMLTMLLLQRGCRLSPKKSPFFWTAGLDFPFQRCHYLWGRTGTGTIANLDEAHRALRAVIFGNAAVDHRLPLIQLLSYRYSNPWTVNFIFGTTMFTDGVHLHQRTPTP